MMQVQFPEACHGAWSVLCIDKIRLQYPTFFVKHHSCCEHAFAIEVWLTLNEVHFQ